MNSPALLSLANLVGLPISSAVGVWWLLGAIRTTITPSFKIGVSTTTAYLVGHCSVVGMPQLPPIHSWHWIPIVAVCSAAVWAGIHRLSAPWKRGLIATAWIALAVWLLASPLWPLMDGPAEVFGSTLGAFALLVIAGFFTARSSKNAPPGRILRNLALVTFAAALISEGYDDSNLGVSAISCSLALLTVSILARKVPSPLSAAATQPLSIAVASLLVAMYLHLWHVPMLSLVLLLSGWATMGFASLPRSRSIKGHVLRIVATLVPLASAVAYAMIL